MWISTSKGKTIRTPMATEIVGALCAAGPDESVVVARDLMRFVHATRRGHRGFTLTVRDRRPERQVTFQCANVHDAAATLIAFATEAAFGTEVVDRAFAVLPRAA